MKWHIVESTIPQTAADLREILLKNHHLDHDPDFFSAVSPLEITLSNVDINQEQLDLAIKRVFLAKENQEKIIVLGDYDADGVCASAILWQTLHNLGCQVMPFIPHREKHGYGLSDKALDDLLAKDKPDLIITVDNGIVAHQPAQRVLDEGIDLIITDHHQPEDKLPPATAVVHSTKLCGATVAWMFARELLKAAGEKINPDWELDLAAIATIADQVPLLKANRSFAQAGLKALQKTTRPGLIALFNQAKINQQKMTAQSVGFGVAPRINAMGRLDNSLDALKLLLTKKQSLANQLAEVLGETNSQRQEMTYEMYGHALAQADEWKDEHLIIVHSVDYHEGVVGLIAGRLMEKFYKPTIAISVGGGIAKASARSIPGVNIVELIRQVRDDLIDVGGHPMAAGFGLKEAKLAQVIARLQKLAKEQIDPQLLDPSLEIETAIPFSLIRESTVDVINEFAPFGQGNREPLLAVKNIEVLQVFTMGTDNQHLKIVGKDSGGATPTNFLFWRRGQLAEKINPGDKIDVAGILEINEWKNRKNVQIRVKDLKINP